jgi:hypothetical protein
VDRIAQLQERASADSAALQLRYNWNTPFFLSPHDPDVLYAGANRVLKSTNRGDDLVPISPDLTRQDQEKIRISTEETGGITPDITGAETFATIVSLAESPLEQGLLYAGTDDGNLWVSPDDGGSWEDVTAQLGDLVPDGTYVSRIEPSHHRADRVYVTFDNHRRGDFTPYVLVSEDRGGSFRSISSDLPTGKPDFAHVIREDPVNEDLLFVGTDVGVYASLDRGGSWQRFMNGLPTAPVRDLQIHPRDGELIAGTHGRSIWIVDITPLQQLDGSVMASDVHLFQPSPAFHFGTRPTGGEFTAQAYFEAPNPPYGAVIRYWLAEDVDADSVAVVIQDPRGDTVRTLSGLARDGWNQVVWDLEGERITLPRSPSERRDSIATERRLAVVVDSLAASGVDEEELDAAVKTLREGSAGSFRSRGGGGGSPQAERWVERPAEGRPISGEGRERGDNLALDILRAVRGEEGGRWWRWGGGTLFPTRSESAPLAEPGTYTVILTAGDRTVSQPLEVSRSATAPEG